jgi:Raf kinase inhibitor-like YbhB/YbcL family protein
MPTPVEGDIDQKGDITLTSPDFDDGERMPDYVGYANENENPPLHIENVPEDAGSLVVVMDDPSAQEVAGHTWDHWMVFDVPPTRTEIPRGWEPDEATEAYNDFVEQGFGGPSPPEGENEYTIKLFAIDQMVEYPSYIRKQRMGSVIAMDCDLLAQTQLRGRYAAEQGTIF